MRILIRMKSPKTGKVEIYRGEIGSKRQLALSVEFFRGGGYTDIAVAPETEPIRWTEVPDGKKSE